MGGDAPLPQTTGRKQLIIEIQEVEKDADGDDIEAQFMGDGITVVAVGQIERFM
jgi:hypothetical protein